MCNVAAEEFSDTSEAKGQLHRFDLPESQMKGRDKFGIPQIRLMQPFHKHHICARA